MPRAATPVVSPAIAPAEPSGPKTVADLLAKLDGIPPSRVRLIPTPGTATEADLLHVLDRENITCELVDGVLVEKAMGFEDAYIAGLLLTYINIYLFANKLGIAAGADGTLKLTTGLIRVPDVSFVAWDHLPGRAFPQAPIPKLDLDLAVDVLSQGNTKAEMARKVGEYFAAGVRVVWLIDPRKRTARVFTAADRSTLLREGDTLDGGDVLPGFALELKTLFDEASRGPVA